MDILNPFVAIVGSLISYILVDYVWKFISHRFWPPKQNGQTYSAQLAKLTKSLTDASKEVDRILRNLGEVASDRHASVSKLESELSQLETKEKELKQRVDTLANLSLPVADQFAQLIQKSEKRSARRDYALFGGGVLVSTIIAIILRLVGWG